MARKLNAHKLRLTIDHGTFTGTVLKLSDSKEVLVVEVPPGMRIRNMDTGLFGPLLEVAKAGDPSMDQPPRPNIVAVRWESGPDYEFQDGAWVMRRKQEREMVMA